ncbi:DcaP family trimeric outer membrane transporter [Paraflavitalea speifideaquila]|uniref:DcaP family trimeric outer membrane transporter n=1 Tax=Paraflavitalea speifideaquila TaxID=3076558 RepID=UPI0028E7C39F|nr:DcaP family trimeric outer membrane transporter [Paraflavitalea speifideiaquila]
MAQKKYICFLGITLCITLLLPAQEKKPDQEKGKGITRNDIESGSYEGLVFTDVKGVRLRFNGFVQGDAIHDLYDMSNKYGFQPSSITIPALYDANTAFGIRQSRFSFTALGPTDSRARILKAVLEFDLWGNNNGNPRLRHAYIQHGKWILGQTWSNFMDANIWPNIVDYWGPNGSILVRQPQIRFTQTTPHQYLLSFSIEQPNADITIPDTWLKRSVYPDLTAAIQKNFGHDSASHLRLGAVLHPLDYKNAMGNKKTTLGYAGNFAGSINLGGKDDVRFQAAYGSGYARYSEGIGGQGYDGYAKGTALEPVDMFSYWVFFDRYWNEKWGSAIGWSSVRLYDTEDRPASVEASQLCCS